MIINPKAVLAAAIVLLAGTLPTPRPGIGATRCNRKR